MSNELVKQDVLNTPTSIEAYADNLGMKLEVCRLMLKSGMLPSAYKSPESVLTAVLYGRELGFSPMRAVHSINVIQGKPTLAASAMAALIIKHGGKIKTKEWTDKVCTLEFHRGDWIETFSYTIQDAALAGLTGKDNWRKMPKPMLYARCVSIGCRNQWADVLSGFYTTEELSDSTTTSPPSEPAPKLPDIELTTADNIDTDTGEVFEVYKYKLDVKDKASRELAKQNGCRWDPDEKVWVGTKKIGELAQYLVSDDIPDVLREDEDNVPW